MTILINNQYLGHGNDELGAKLMGSFLRSLLATEAKPDKIIFYNSGVKLLATDHATHDTLDELERAGVRLVACGTCVSFFKLDEQIPKPRVSNMQEIVSILTSGDVVTV